MGHDFIHYTDRHVHLNDLDIWTLRYFFLRQAQTVTAADLDTDEGTMILLRRFLEGWDWLGPGVITGTSLEDFVQDQPKRANVLLALFERMVEYLQGFGKVIPLEYLQEHVNSPLDYFTAGQPTQRFIKAVKRLSDMLHGPLQSP